MGSTTVVVNLSELSVIKNSWLRLVCHWFAIIDLRKSSFKTGASNMVNPVDYLRDSV